MKWYWLYLHLLVSRNGIRLCKGGIHLILCLALLCVFKTAISVGPVPSILHFMDQVWAEAVLIHCVRALKWVQGSIFILGVLWDLTKEVVG